MFFRARTHQRWLPFVWFCFQKWYNPFFTIFGTEDVLVSPNPTDAKRVDCNMRQCDERVRKTLYTSKDAMYQRAKFSYRKQELHEAVDVFVIDLCEIANKCE